MSDIIPIFSSHYSYLHSILTLEEAGKTKPGNPVSICDLAKDHGLKQVVICDERIDGFIEAYKNLSKIGAQLIFGVKIVVCADETDKSDESLKTESNVIIFVKSSQGYSDLIRVYNRAWTTGFYYQGRTSWRELKALWTDNLSLALPTYSSFIFKNQMTFANIVPDLPARPTVFREVDSGLPFAPIVDKAITEFATRESLPIQPTKSIYYAGPEDFDAYTTFRAIGNRSEFGRPNVDHMCSDRFSFKAWQQLAAQTP